MEKSFIEHETFVEKPKVVEVETVISDPEVENNAVITEPEVIAEEPAPQQEVMIIDESEFAIDGMSGDPVQPEQTQQQGKVDTPVLPKSVVEQKAEEEVTNSGNKGFFFKK